MTDSVHKIWGNLGIEPPVGGLSVDGWAELVDIVFHGLEPCSARAMIEIAPAGADPLLKKMLGVIAGF